MFYNKIRGFFNELGIAQEMTEKFEESGSYDYVGFLENEVGAKKVYYRQSLRAIEGIGHRGLILPGGNVVVTTTLPDGSKAVLIQKREKDEIGFSGGAIEEWEYNGRRAIEAPLLGAYREFFEEVGARLDSELEYFCENTSTIVYPNEDVAYGLSLFYKIDMPYEAVAKFAEGGSYEGKMALIKVSDIKNYKLFPNHKPVFEKIMAEAK